MDPKYKGTSLEAIAERLKVIRKAHDLNQAEACARTGIATNTWNQWEKSVQRPELDKAMMICDIFNVSLDWIYRGDPRGIPHEIATLVFRATA